MLSVDVKRRIDGLRDTLVGKLPDPKAQVEQITIALMYKFMSDMDEQALDIGGEASFFKPDPDPEKDYARYAWRRIMSPELGGEERVHLYMQGIERMPVNPHLPQLFRDIFRNAYLPYRDPETLRLFLTGIAAFDYSDSESLGDAYEYLLSVLGSQGEAGQFRTPRHIIDMMVKVVDPHKESRILDPACGTAGFLISSWKHILTANKDRPLTPAERARLMANVTGYDISPDMTRLSRVNMYLHSFPDPHIYEYDTLTSEERWNERFDIIMANPPFMTPKGGIRPHNRFAVHAKRSEVLFVDYIAEHLAPGGRAGVIVPEGIVFQSANAYKALRRMLINDSLIGVISLPSGVFMPYTGVKTSILVLDKTAARIKPKIMFTVVKDIGMSLGIKRTPTEQNDLPTVIEDYCAYYNDKPLSPISWLVDRDQVLGNGCLLSAERYRPTVTNGTSRLVSLGEVCTITKGKSSSTQTEPGNYPLVVRGANRLTSSTYQFENPAVCIPLLSLVHGKGVINRLHFETGKFAVANLMAAAQPNNYDELNAKYLYLVLDSRKQDIANLMQGAIYVTLKIEDLATIQIPLPPIEVQREIVAEVESYQRVIDGARQVVESYKPHITIDPAWPLVKLGEVCETASGGTPLRSKAKYFENGDIPWLRSGEVSNGYIYEAANFITKEGLENSSAKIFPIDTVLVAMYGATAGQVGILKIEASTNQAICGIMPSSLFYPDFLYQELKSLTQYMISMSTGGAQPNISQTIIKELKLPLPSLEVQQRIVAELSREQALVSANRELIALMEAKIKARIARVWGE